MNGLGYYAIVFGAVMLLGLFAALGTPETDGGSFGSWLLICVGLAALTCGLTAIFDAAGAV